MIDPLPGGKAGEGQPGPAGTGLTGGIGGLVVAGAADGIVGVDDQGIIRLCNQAAEELLGRPEAELLGAPFGLPVISGQATEVELRLPSGGSRTVEMRAATAMVQGEPLHIVSLRDVTRRRQAERDLQAALERQNLVVAVAAHQLHNPVAAISMLAHVLRDQQVSMRPEDRAQIIDQIIERISRMQALVRNLLTASRIDAVGVRPAATRVPVLDAIVEQLAVIEDRSEEVRVSCSPGLAVTADPDELAMMLANYIDNALSYGSPPIEIEATERDGWAEIRVTDHGRGVPAGFVPRLFERYSRGPESRKTVEGTGLGLWIVATFTAANGGDAWYEPGEDGGACFCLRLPLAQAPAGEQVPRQAG
jgi:signal transduction histidine kinase